MPQNQTIQPGAKLADKRIAILATDGFEQSELTEPQRLLAEAGAQVTVIAPEGKSEIKGWDHTDWGRAVRVDRPLSQAKIDDYDALVLPGGVLNPDKLRTDEAAVRFVKDFAATGKPLAAICHGPIMLIEAGVAKGKSLTSWPSVRTDLQNAGATWRDEAAVVDGPLVTSRKPDDIPQFVDALTRMMTAGRSAA